MHPSGRSLVCGMSIGGLERVDLQPSSSGGPPQLSLSQGGCRGEDGSEGCAEGWVWTIGSPARAEAPRSSARPKRGCRGHRLARHALLKAVLCGQRRAGVADNAHAPLKASTGPVAGPLNVTPSIGGVQFFPGAGEFKEAARGIGPVKGMSFSSDGRLLALGGEDGGIEVWEWPAMRRRLRCEQRRAVRCPVQGLAMRWCCAESGRAVSGPQRLAVRRCGGVPASLQARSCKLEARAAVLAPPATLAQHSPAMLP